MRHQSIPGFLTAQKTSVFTEKTAEFERGLDLYDQGIYGAAFSAFEHSSKIDDANNDPKVTLLTAKSKLMMGKSSVRIGKPDAEMVMLTYFRQNQPDALAYEAVILNLAIIIIPGKIMTKLFRFMQ